MKVKNKSAFTRYPLYLKEQEVSAKEIVKAIKEGSEKIKEAIENQ